MKSVFVVIFISLSLYSSTYTKVADSKNIYYTSTHFRAIIGVANDDSTLANMLLDSAEASWEKEVDNLGFKEPRNTPTKKIDIYIGNKDAYNYETGNNESIDSGYAGWAKSYNDNTAYIVMNPNMTDNQLKVTISHEFYHTIQYAYFDETLISDEKWYKNIWWMEATATLMEDEVYDDVDDYLTFLENYTDIYGNVKYGFFAKSYKSFEIYDGWHEYSMAIFAKYIKEKYGMQIIKDSLSAIETSGSDGYFEILDTLLQNSYNSSMKESLNEFTKWISNSSKYFEEGSLYPSLTHFNVSDNITLEKGGVVVLDNLKSGWNMSALSSSDISSLDISSLNYVWSYENGTWSNNIQNSSYDKILNTNISKGYWVNVSQDTSTYYTYLDNTGLFDASELNYGWNLVSTTTNLTKNNFGNVFIVWQYINGIWKAYSSNTSISENLNSDGYEELQSILPYSSYWVYK